MYEGSLHSNHKVTALRHWGFPCYSTVAKANSRTVPGLPKDRGTGPPQSLCLDSDALFIFPSAFGKVPIAEVTSAELKMFRLKKKKFFFLAVIV